MYNFSPPLHILRKFKSSKQLIMNTTYEPTFVQFGGNYIYKMGCLTPPPFGTPLNRPTLYCKIGLKLYFQYC